MAKELLFQGLRRVESAPLLSIADQLELAIQIGAAGLLTASNKLLEPLLNDADVGPRARREKLINEFSLREEFLNSFIPMTGNRSHQRHLLDQLGVPESIETRFFGIDALVWRKKGHARTLFYFTGAARRNLPRIAMLHKTFMDLGCNVVYVRDHQKLWHLGGLAGMPSVDPAGMAQELLRLHKSLGGSEIFTIGSSVGGYAALRYGLILEAKAAFSFSGFTNIRLTESQISQYSAVKRLHGHNPKLLADLLELYGEAKLTPRMTLCFGAAHEVDSRQAMRMASVPGTKLIPVPDLAEHDTIKYFQSTGGMPALMKDFLNS